MICRVTPSFITAAKNKRHHYQGRRCSDLDPRHRLDHASTLPGIPLGLPIRPPDLTPQSVGAKRVLNPIVRNSDFPEAFPQSVWAGG